MLLFKNEKCFCFIWFIEPTRLSSSLSPMYSQGGLCSTVSPFSADYKMEMEEAWTEIMAHFTNNKMRKTCVFKRPPLVFTKTCQSFRENKINKENTSRWFGGGYTRAKNDKIYISIKYSEKDKIVLKNWKNLNFGLRKNLVMKLSILHFLSMWLYNKFACSNNGYFLPVVFPELEFLVMNLKYTE